MGPLTALDAEVVLDELGACRTMPVTELIAAPGKTILQEREFIRSIRLPKLEKGSQSRFFKVGRRSALAISRLTLSLLLTVNGDGTVKEMRAAIGAVFPRPVRFRKLEYTLVGKELTDERIEIFADQLAAKIPEIAGRRSSTDYKQPVCRMVCVRLLREMREAYGTSSDPI